MIRCRNIADALRIVAIVIYQTSSPHVDENSIYADTLKVASPLVNAVQELHSIAVRANCHISTFNFQIVFPLLRGVLALRSPLPGCEEAFSVLDRYAPLVCLPELFVEGLYSYIHLLSLGFYVLLV